jgi:hypothetical protein
MPVGVQADKGTLMTSYQLAAITDCDDVAEGDRETPYLIIPATLSGRRPRTADELLARYQR